MEPRFQTMHLWENIQCEDLKFCHWKGLCTCVTHVLESNLGFFPPHSFHILLFGLFVQIVHTTLDPVTFQVSSDCTGLAWPEALRRIVLVTNAVLPLCSLSTSRTLTSRYLFIWTLDFIFGFCLEECLPVQGSMHWCFCSPPGQYQNVSFGFWMGSQERDLTSVLAGRLFNDSSQLLSFFQHHGQLCQFCWDLGVVINMEQSDHESSSTVQYLGIRTNTIWERVFSDGLLDCQI